MLFSSYIGEKIRLIMANRFLTVLMCVQVLVTIASLVMLNKALVYQRTILVPMQITHEMQFIGNEGDDNYFRDIGLHMAFLAYNYSPSNAKTQFNDLLRMFTPQDHSAARLKFQSLLGKIQDTKASSVFYPHKTYVDKEKKVLEIQGKRIILAQDGSLVDSQAVTYGFAYTLENDKFQLTDIHEVLERHGSAPVDAPIPENRRLE